MGGSGRGGRVSIARAVPSTRGQASGDCCGLRAVAMAPPRTSWRRPWRVARARQVRPLRGGAVGTRRRARSMSGRPPPTRAVTAAGTPTFARPTAPSSCISTRGSRWGPSSSIRGRRGAGGSPRRCCRCLHSGSTRRVATTSRWRPTGGRSSSPSPPRGSCTATHHKAAARTGIPWRR